MEWSAIARNCDWLTAAYNELDTIPPLSAPQKRRHEWNATG